MSMKLYDEDEEDFEEELTERQNRSLMQYGILLGVVVLLGILAALVVLYFIGDGDEASVKNENVVVQVTPTPTEAPTPSPSPTPSPTPGPTPTVEPTMTPEPTPQDPYADMNFREVYEEVTAKESTNLRDIPSQGKESHVLAVLPNGEVAVRIAISDMGWSKLEYNGEEYYAVSSLLTTDLSYHVAVPEDDGIKTEFTPCNDKVSPKIEVNLRKLPSVTNPDATVVVTLKYGEVVNRTGINTDVGWSRVEYNGETLYCVSSYVYVVE